MHTIIIPVYNAEKTIQQCIDSILVQNNRDFELIIINDGSTDNSGKICENKAQKDSRIKVFHKPNGGVSSARNLGLEQAKGEWITFIDADDYIEQDFLPNCNNSKADLIIQNWEYIGDSDTTDNIEKEFIKIENKKKFLDKHLHKDIFRCPWGKFYKLNIIKNNSIKFDIKYKIGEDTLFVLDYLYNCNTIEVINSSFYKYRINDNTSKYKECIDTTLSYIEDFWKKYKKINCKNKKLIAILYSYFYNNTINIEKEEVNKKWMTNNYIIYMLSFLYYSKGLKNRIIYYKLIIKSFIEEFKLGIKKKFQ